MPTNTFQVELINSVVGHWYHYVICLSIHPSVALFFIFFCIVSTSASDCLERLISEM